MHDHTNTKAGQIAQGVDLNNGVRNLYTDTNGALFIEALDSSGNPQSIADAVAAGVSGGGGASVVHSTAYQASRVLKSSAGTLLLLYGYNSGPAQFLQLHDSAALPADTAVPVAIFAVGAASNFSLAITIGQPFATGIVVCNSSTGPTKTIGGADCFFSALVK